MSLPIELKSWLIGQSSYQFSPPDTHPATYSPLKYLLVPEQPSTHSWVNFSCLPFTATLSPVFYTEVRPICTALPLRRTSIGRQCNSVETAQPGDRTTDPGIVMPERYQSSWRVDLLARVVITPVRLTHTLLHIDKNPCPAELFALYFSFIWRWNC